MTTTERYSDTTSRVTRQTGLARFGQVAFGVLAILLVIGVAGQVFLAGAGALVSPAYWGQHRLFAHLVEAIPILLLITGLIGRLPRRVHLVNGLFFLLFFLQYIFLAMPEFGLPVLSGLHAANALTLFLVALNLGRTGYNLIRLPGE